MGTGQISEGSVRELGLHSASKESSNQSWSILECCLCIILISEVPKVRFYSFTLSAF